MGVKQILLMMVAVVLVGCGEKAASPTPKGEPKIPAPRPAAEAEAQVTPEPPSETDPVSPVNEKLIADPIVEKAVRASIEKPEGALTKSDLGRIKGINFYGTTITDAGLQQLAKLQNLESLNLGRIYVVH